MSDTTIPFPALDEILRGFGAVAGSPATPVGQELLKLLKEWQAYFQKLGFSASIDAAQLPPLLAALSTALEAPSREAELKLLEAASQNPLYGLMLVFAALPGTADRQSFRWWKMLFHEQKRGDPGIFGKTRTLPAPGPGTKYLILSDVHRDAASDDLGPFQSGSIDHFKANSTLYQHVLDWADKEGHVVLEGGDCEELWFVRNIAEYPRKADGIMDVAAKLREIIKAHPKVYEKLRSLHERGRYFRIYGNHDSFLKPDGADDSVFQVLRAEMQLDNTVPFEIWDTFLIPGVKTMMEYAALDILEDAASLAKGDITPHQFTERLFRGRVGLDAADYTATSRMLVTHGHQFDFWNSPENEILGLLIANTVGMFVDRNMDPFLDVRGIALEGNPFLEFDDIFARLPVFDSWPSGNAAVAYADQVRHMPNGQRVLNDTVFYYESVPALWAAFGIAMNHTRPDGTEATPDDSRKELNLRTVDGIMTYLGRHHFHHLCVGHTHTPHSQPAFTLANVGSLVPPLWPVTWVIQALLPSFLEPQIKSGYFNSGTAGWMEGVVWAIEIDETGQAKLLFWTENRIHPETMDWELGTFPTELKGQLREGLARALGAPVAELGEHVDDIWKSLQKRLADFQVAAEEGLKALERSVILPIQALALALVQKNVKTLREWVLEEVAGARKSVAGLEKQLEQLRSFTFDVLLSAKRRALSGFDAPGDTETLELKAPISDRERARLLRFQKVLMAMGMSDAQALHCAAVGLSVFDQFPRNLPFFSGKGHAQNPEARLHNSRAPVLQAMLGTLWMYPPAGSHVEVQGVRIASRFILEARHVRLSVTLSRATGDTGTGVA